MSGNLSYNQIREIGKLIKYQEKLVTNTSVFEEVYEIEDKHYVCLFPSEYRESELPLTIYVYQNSI